MENMKNAKKKKSEILFIFCILGYFVLFLGNFILDSFSGEVINLGRGVISVSSFNGVLNSLQVLLCTVMVCINYKRGLYISFVLFSFSLIGMFRTIIFAHILAPIPGITYVVISIFTLTVLAHYLKQRDIDLITDSLTGLSNRNGLIRILNKKCSDNAKFDVVYVDLDDFKFINDNLGHKGGDIVLKTVANRLVELVGKNGVVSRIGGDEFLLLVPELSETTPFINQIINYVARKIDVIDEETNKRNVREIYVTTSVGVAKYPEHSTNPDELIKFADLAMYNAKKEGKNKGLVFDFSFDEAETRKSRIEALIKKSLDKDYFYLVYQPQFGTEDHKLRGFETLLRLKTPEGKMVSPGEFIPIAEDTNLISHIDDYVLKRALHEFREVMQKRKEKIILSINMSAKDICMAGFAKYVEQAIVEENFPPECLEIEITEYCFAHSQENASENITRLRELGVHIALDDFGTGYASLSYLTKLPIDLLKIDKSFIDNIETDKKSKAFMDTVISIGRLHGCKIISEGVESEKQVELIRDAGCDYIQGYVWGKPLSYDDAIALCSE